MPWRYMAGRLLMFVVTIWMASTIVFFLPRLRGKTRWLRRSIKTLNVAAIRTQPLKKGFGFLSKSTDSTNRFGSSNAKFVGDVVQYRSRAIDLPVAEVGQRDSCRKNYVDAFDGSVDARTRILNRFDDGRIARMERNNWGLMVAMAPILAISAIPFFIFGLVLQLLVFNVNREFPMVYGFQTRRHRLARLVGLGIRPQRAQTRHSSRRCRSHLSLLVDGRWALRGMMVTTKGEGLHGSS